MGYKKFKIALIVRITALFLALILLAYTVAYVDFVNELPLAIVLLLPTLSLVIFFGRNLVQFSIKRFYEIDDFFESIKYRDFSRWFTVKSGPEDIRALHRGFNNVNATIKEINAEKEAQHLYLQKILELVGTGIVAYNIDSGQILWINEAFKKVLDIPTLKNTSFVRKRNPEMHKAIFRTDHGAAKTIPVVISKIKQRILISNSVFQINEDSFNLIVIQNIDTPLNQTESDAWKKLLSVMTHEIMNSIAPISSLAETLQFKVKEHLSSPEIPLEVEDLNTGIESIKNRSEGLLKFAKTYRSLNKITSLNLERIFIRDLFKNIHTLMSPSIKTKQIALEFNNDLGDLQIAIDKHLIEQVLINLILNAIEACKNMEDGKIAITTLKDLNGKAIIKVSDNGKGIPKEILDDIYVPFFSTKKNGSGIGLSLSKQIMLLHNGSIEAYSVEGRGTAISLIF